MIPRWWSRTVFGMVAVTVGSACTEQSPRLPAGEQAAHVAEVVAAGGAVDSILPIAEHLQRFRAPLARTDTLRHASRSLAALVDRWAAAVGASDTAAFNAMIIDRAEFAWLYYPDSPMSKPPYEAPPELLWGQLLAASNKGAAQLVNRFGGSHVTARQLRCAAPPDTQGTNVLHTGCEVRLAAPGKQTVDGVLFGTILERDGRFKFVGLSTRL